MKDLLFVGTIVGFFALVWVYLRAIDRLRARGNSLERG